MAVSAVTFYSPAGNGKVKTNDSLGTWIVNAGSMALGTVTFVEGTGAISDKVSATTRTAYDITAADLTGEPWNFASGQADDGEHIVVWLYMYEGWNSLVNGGFGVIVADDLATDSFGTWYLGPQAGYIGGWYPYIVSPKKAFDAVTAGTANWTTTGNPAQLTGVDGFGARWNVLSTITGATDNVYMDAIVVGQGYQITNGDSTDPDAKFSDFITFEENTTNGRFGFLRPISGIPFMRGKVIIGFTSGAGDTVFTDSGFTVVWEKVTLSDGTSSAVDAGFYELKFSKGSGTTDVTMSQGVLKAVSPHTVVLNFAGITSATLTGVNVDRGDAITLDAAVTWTNSVLTNCDAVAVAGAVFTGNTLSGYTGAADTSQLVWNDSGDPDGNLDNCKITKGTNAHHAITLGASAPAMVTLRGLTFTSFNAADAANDSVILLADTGSDRSWTINAVLCTGTVSVKKTRSGDSFTVVSNPVTFSVTAKNLDTGAVIQNARVMVPVTTNDNFPYQASVTITSSGTTATVAHTGHGRATNDNILIAGADQDAYNGAYTITLDGADPTNKYTYTMPDTAASPATGTITATMVLLNGFTNASGVITDSRTYSVSQPVSGWVRRHTYGPSFDTATWTDASSTLTKTGAFTGMSGTFLITITAGTNMTSGVYLATWVNANDVTLPGGAGSADSSNVAFTIGAKPLYRQAPVADTVDNTNGKSVTVFLQPDE